MSGHVKPVLVVGSSNTDLIASVNRLPAEGETVLGSDLEQFAGGKGANQAVAAVRAGAPVAFCGCVGEDAFGDAMVEGLGREGIDLGLLRRVGDAPSGTALIAVDSRGRNQIVVVPGANAFVDEAQMNEIDFSAFGLAVFQLELPTGTVWRGLQRARAEGCPTLLNPAPAADIPDEIYRLIDYLVPNEHELQILAGQTMPVAESADCLLEKGVHSVIVTLGGAGAICCRRSGHIEVPAPEVHVVDTVGAGDAFVGVFAATMAAGCDLKESMVRSVCAASLSVQSSGAQVSYPGAPAIEAMVADFHRKHTRS